MSKWGILAPGFGRPPTVTVRDGRDPSNKSTRLFSRKAAGEPLCASPAGEKILRFFPAGELSRYMAPGAIALMLFVGDLLIARGATAAIGYCAIPVLAGRAHRRDFLIGTTIACIILTWVGFCFEPPGAAAWMSVFDRAMITGALCLIGELVLRRNHAVAALTHQTLLLQTTTRELERSNAELDTFASMVAHDIRGPLNTISLYSELIGQSPTSKVKPAECATIIQTQIASLSDLIKTLLAYGQIGGGNLRVAPCDCEAILDSVRQKLRALCEQSGAGVTNDPLPTMPADPILIAELLQNLIENGIKYCGKEPPRIHVSAVQSPEGWQFSVRDNGVGIEAHDLDRIFHPFCQAGRAGSRRGVGLGLATCKRIVERHGGSIKVASTRRGSTFTFTIPVRSDADAPRPLPSGRDGADRNAAQISRRGRRDT